MAAVETGEARPVLVAPAAPSHISVIERKATSSMADKKTIQQLEAENADLVAALDASEKKIEKMQAEIDELLGGSRKVIAIVSRTGQSRNRGGITVPPDHPIVIAVDSIDPKALGEIEGDPQILKVRTDSEVTPDHEIVRY
jgi:hypothetical protein